MARPIIVSTAQLTDTTRSSLVVGAAVGSSTPVRNSGMKVATVSIESLAAPDVTTNALYNVSGALSWNGTTLATGSTISGTTNTIGKFTGVASMGDSRLTESGTTVTMAGTLAATTFSGSGASLTSIPTSAVSSGSFVATVASGTGITSSVTTGNAAATTISLNNTAVTPASYGANCGVSLTVDQQGRLTAVASLTTLHPTAAPAAAGTIGFSSNLLINQGGSSGHQWVNAANNAQLMALTDAGTFSLGSNITLGVGAPTFADNHFGPGTATIVGKSYGFVITCGASADSSGIINFGTTYASAPSITIGTSGLATGGSSAFVYVASVTTTQCTLFSYDAAGSLVVFSDAQVIDVHVDGF